MPRTDPAAPPAGPEREPTWPDLRTLAERVLAAAGATGRTLATAESCTGGLVGHLLTEVPGASAVYLGGVVSYSDEVKAHLLGVAPEVLEAHGAVSAQVAVAMAEGVRRATGADLGISITGIAGPDGGRPDKPVGLTYVALSGPDGPVVRRHLWSGDRSHNKLASAAAALALADERLAQERAPRPAGGG